MALPGALQVKLRSAYVSRKVSLADAAREFGVEYNTAAAWKRRARARGDDWDRARQAVQLTGGSFEDGAQALLEDWAALYQETAYKLRESSADPLEVVNALSKLASAYQKIVSATAQLDPGLARLGIALEVLKLFGEYIRQEYGLDNAELAGLLCDALEGFGEKLAAEWGEDG